jgi:hypothetical protein
MEKSSGFKIGEKASIPDSDMEGWISTLREAGFSDKELDSILSRLNRTYAEQKGKPHIEERIEEDLKEIDTKTKERRGHGLTEEEKEYFRHSIRTRYE